MLEVGERRSGGAEERRSKRMLLSLALFNYFTSKLATKVFEPPTEIVPRYNAAIAPC
ncbi:MAG: hypothetical protein F6K41_20355 [Symploca sp. SIO3E6]|nr:hypothetical protein [Caldora sp. SIO3E6]